MASWQSGRGRSRTTFVMISCALIVVGSAAAIAALYVITNPAELAMLVECSGPADIRCSDNFFFGVRGGRNTLGTGLIFVALVLWFSSGVTTALAARRHIPG